jgi:hypothetical protein
MTTYTLRSNLDTTGAPGVLVPDLGLYVPPAGGFETFSDDGNIAEVNESLLNGSLALLTQDGFFPAGADPSPNTIIIEINGTEVPPGEADRAVNVVPLTIETQDGVTTVLGVTKIKVTNGTLTDDGAGVISIDTGGGGTSDYAGKFEGISIGTGDIPDGKWGWWFDTASVPNRMLHIRNRSGTLYATEANPL